MSQAFTKHTVLVVEDEAPIADTIEYALLSDGFTCLRATTGVEAVRMVRETAIDIVVLDVGLPDCNGFDLLRRLRRFSEVPVLFLTARAAEIDRVVGLEIGGDDYLTKPFSPRELVARIKAVLRRAGPGKSSSAPSSKGDTPFHIDDEKHRIYFFDTLLGLSRIEYRLLRALLNHPGRVYSRPELMDTAWDDGQFSFDRTVDTHIKTLRGKLREVYKGSDPIVTHRGIGYSLRDEW